MLQGKTAGAETIWPVLAIALFYFAHTKTTEATAPLVHE